MEIDVALTEPQLQFVSSLSAHPGIVGGLGCVHPDTRIWTERGLMRIADVTSAIRVLSWNEKSQRFQLSLSGGSFPKGIANLYRVVTQQGEFVATAHHQIFSSCRSYQPLADMNEHSALLAASQYLLCSMMEYGLKSFPVDDQHLSQTLEDSMARCAGEARLYGQQLQTEEGICQALAQEQAYAHKSVRIFDLRASLREDGQVGQIQEHSHPYQSFCRSQMQDCDHLAAEPDEASARCALTLSSEHTLHYPQQSQQSHARCERHHKALVWPARDAIQNLSLAYSNPPVESSILAVLEAERNHVYYDLQVLDTNNYIDEFGHIHHNSGKTRAGTMRAVALLLSDPGCNIGIFLPTYDLLKLRAMPGVEEDLQMVGATYTINKSEYRIEVEGYGFIIFRSYDNPARIVSFEISDAIVDEIDTLKKEQAELVWRKISERVRQKRNRINTVAVVTTPDQGINGFVYEKWVKKQQAGYELIKAPTTSNPFLPDGYIEQIRANYDPVLADLYINGEFVSLNDKKVYHFFSRSRHHNQRTIQQSDWLHVSIDFNIGGCCATTWVIENNKPIAVDEFVSHDTADFINNLSRYKGHKITVYPDASGGSERTNASASDIKMIEHAGFSVDSPSKNPFVRDRINAFNALLAHDRIGINCDKCPNLANALEVQGYTDKGEPEKFNDHPAVDDWVDSSGYFIHRRFPINAPLTGGVKFGRR